MLAGYAPSTQLKYDGLLNAVRLEETIYGVSDFFLPMNSPQKVVLFFSGQEGNKWSKVESFRSAITAWHRVRLLPDPPLHVSFLKPFWHGLRKTCDNIRQASKPINKALVYDLCRHWLQKDTHAGARDAFYASIQFFGMRRQGEVSVIQHDDLEDQGEGNGFNLRIRRAKNDPYGRGLLVPLPEITADGFPLGVGYIFINLFYAFGRPSRRYNARACR